MIMMISKKKCKAKIISFFDNDTNLFMYNVKIIVLRQVSNLGFF